MIFDIIFHKRLFGKRVFVKQGGVLKFYGREKEFAELKRIHEISHEISQFAVVMGRRRVGKTELVEKALNDGENP